MKRRRPFHWLLTLLVSIILAGSTNAQTLKDVFGSSETPLTYLGVDFTLARLINATEIPSDIRDRHYPGINEVIINEPKKYDLAGAFHKTTITTDIKQVAKRNAAINTEEIKSSNAEDYNRLKVSDIKELVKKFDFGDKKGVGLLFVVDGMSKSDKGAGIWVTLVNMGSNKVLMTERIIGKPGGFGFRNYWAASIREVIESIDKKKYAEWKSSNGG